MGIPSLDRMSIQVEQPIRSTEQQCIRLLAVATRVLSRLSRIGPML